MTSRAGLDTCIGRLLLQSHCLVSCVVDVLLVKSYSC